MPTWSAWRIVWVCSASLLPAVLAGCSGTASVSGQQLAKEPLACQPYRSAWVSLFKANVQALNSAAPLEPAYTERLQASRQTLSAAGLDESSCSRPHCIIRPLQGGKLDSYCGYRLAVTEGDDRYQWIPWSGQ